MFNSIDEWIAGYTNPFIQKLCDVFRISPDAFSKYAWFVACAAWIIGVDNNIFDIGFAVIFGIGLLYITYQLATHPDQEETPSVLFIRLLFPFLLVNHSILFMITTLDLSYVALDLIYAFAATLGEYAKTIEKPEGNDFNKPRHNV